MSIISLTSDFGYKDYFIGAIKGAIYKENPSAKIVDVSHEVGAFNHNEAAYILKNAFSTFPKKSIHLILVDSEIHIDNPFVVVLYKEHYFVCANNGILSLITNGESPNEIIALSLTNNLKENFPINSTLINATISLSQGKPLSSIGTPIESIKESTMLKPVVSNNQIAAHVIYIDNYQNVVTNITKDIFDSINKDNKPFEIKNRSIRFSKIVNSYNDVDAPSSIASSIAFFNSSGYLEFSVYKSDPKIGGAKSLFGLDFGDNIILNFD